MSYAIGIDFGCQASCVAVVRGGQVETIANDMGNRVTPSTIGFNEREALIGDPAVQQFAKNAKNTIVNAKRLLGQEDFDAELVQDDITEGYFSCKVVAGEKNLPMFEVLGGKKISAEEVTSMVLKKMRDTAEKFLGAEITKAVIGVPSYFKEPELEALKRAATTAGLDVLRFVNESSCATMAHGFDETKNKKTVVVFDLGAGNLDVALVQVDDLGQMKVLSTRSDSSLGGEKINHKLLDFCKKDFRRKHRGKAALLDKSDKAIFRLLAECESAKKTLSASAQAPIEVDMLVEGQDFAGNISRERFDELNEEFFSECMEIIDELFDPEENEHGVEKENVTSVLLVGGSSKIVKITELIQEHFSSSVQISTGDKVIQDEAVACGAAIQAHLLLEDQLNFARGLKEGGDVDMEDLVISDAKNLQMPILKKSVGLAGKDGKIVSFLKSGMGVPAQHTEYVQAPAEGQNLVLSVYQGEAALAKDCKLLVDVAVPVSLEADSKKVAIKLQANLDGKLVVEVDSVEVARV